MQSIDEQWRTAFLQIIQQHENASVLKEAALQERLGDWTKALTTVVIATCKALCWKSSAKGHRLDLLPAPRCEYLSLDVVAFPEGEKRWRFPIAVLELENSPVEDRIAYSLWKTLCVRADLRIVYCYRQRSDEGSVLIRFLRDEVVHAMGLQGRMKLEGQTLVVVGSLGDSTTFPYSFFKWWQLDTNLGTFRLM